jgi:hypothetical protein
MSYEVILSAIRSGKITNADIAKATGIPLEKTGMLLRQMRDDGLVHSPTRGKWDVTKSADIDYPGPKEPKRDSHTEFFYEAEIGDSKRIEKSPASVVRYYNAKFMMEGKRFYYKSVGARVYRVWREY